MELKWSISSVRFGIIPQNVCGREIRCKYTQEDEWLDEQVGCLGRLLARWTSSSIRRHAAYSIDRNRFHAASSRTRVPSVSLSYRNECDVDQIKSSFDQRKIPYDVLWLDIEHTDGKRYFTWNPIHFSSPILMHENLAIVGSNVVTIVDSHIRIDPADYAHSK